MSVTAGEESYLLTVSGLHRETADTVSITFAVPDGLAPAFERRAGQFLTLGVPSDRTGLVARCYSICTPPGEALTVTVKRTADGYASNWLHDHLAVGDAMRVLPPAGIFTPRSLDDDLLLWAAGSGITPVMSILRAALRDGTGRIVLFDANTDERSVIFAEALRDLAAVHPDRFTLVHWLESERGLPGRDDVREFAAAYADRTSFCCGPAPFMEVVAGALRELGFPRARRHQEKFVSLGGSPFGDVEGFLAAESTLAGADDGLEEGDGPVTVEVDLDGRHHAFDDWSGTEPLLEFLESKGIKAPYSCRQGECSACAYRILEGEVALRRNEVLDQADLDHGIRLACQALAASGKLRISYHG